MCIRDRISPVYYCDGCLTDGGGEAEAAAQTAETNSAGETAGTNSVSETAETNSAGETNGAAATTGGNGEAAADPSDEAQQPSEGSYPEDVYKRQSIFQLTSIISGATLLPSMS